MFFLGKTSIKKELMCKLFLKNDFEKTYTVSISRRNDTENTFLEDSISAEKMVLTQSEIIYDVINSRIYDLEI